MYIRVRLLVRYAPSLGASVGNRNGKDQAGEGAAEAGKADGTEGMVDTRQAQMLGMYTGVTQQGRIRAIGRSRTSEVVVA